ncbi:MAG TPA: hypothetical protein VGM12_27650 [Trebonia sp.]|jgi:hypothetical protein
MTTDSGANARAGAAAGGARRPMRFSVDGWDPSYGASLEVEGQLEESTATIDADVELPAGRWRPVDPDSADPLPDALLFVDGVRRVEAQVWVDGEPGPVDEQTGEILAAEATAALCASYAAGVVCCCAAGAHVVVAELRRGLFSVAPHASDILTRAGGYKAHHVTLRRASTPVMRALSQSLQDRLAEVEVVASNAARGEIGAASAAFPAGHAAGGVNDLLILDGPLHNRQHLPRALGYIKSHNKTYLPPELNTLVGRLTPGQRTPVFRMGTSWDRHSWYLRLPGPAGAPWSGIVRIECAAALPVAEVLMLARLSQRCLGRFASSPYKDSRAPQNLYPIGGLERELRRRLGDPKLLYRALREAAQTDPGRPAAVGLGAASRDAGSWDALATPAR